MELELKHDPAFLVLAAGFSRRFAAGSNHKNKLTVALENGKSVLQQSLETLQSVSPSVCVVTNKEMKSTGAILTEQKFASASLLECTSGGLGESIACGVAATESASGWVLCLADMPFISRDIYLQVLHQIAAHPQNIIRPRWRNQAGHPVYFPRRFFKELCALTGDEGAKSIIERHNEAALYFDVDDASVIQDIDTVLDLKNKNGLP